MTIQPLMFDLRRTVATITVGHFNDAQVRSRLKEGGIGIFGFAVLAIF